VFGVRTVPFYLAVLCLAPLWAEDDRPFEIGAEYEAEAVKAYFTDGIFRFEATHDTSTNLTRRLNFSWPILEDSTKPWRFSLEVQPGIWETERDRRLDHEPLQQEEFYAGVQYLSDKLDARLLHPLAKTISGRELGPMYLELKYLRIFELDQNTEVFARGMFSQDHADFDLGVSRRFGSIQAKIYSDFKWSLGFSTTMSTPLR